MAVAEHFLDRYLDPVAEVLSPPVAQKILDLRPAPDIVARVEEVGAKANAGLLSDEERDAYQALADAGTLVALLKAKARRVLAVHSG